MADLGVGEAFVGQVCDLRFLWCERLAGVGGALAHCLAGSQQFALRALGEGVRSHRFEGGESRFELNSRIDTAMFTTKPLAVDELRAGMVDGDT